MKHLAFRISVAAALVLLAGVLAGCGSCKPGKQGDVAQYNIEVALDSSLANASVVVDLVGVNSSDLPRWMAHSMTSYWKNDSYRQDADKVVLNFVSAGASTTAQTFYATNAAWLRWKGKGVRHVLVLADLPRIPADLPDTQDPRRQVLALDKCSWPGGSAGRKGTGLKVMVQHSGITVLTPPRSQ